MPVMRVAAGDGAAQRVDGVDQGGGGRGQEVVGRPHEKADRLVDLVEIRIRPDRRELRDARPARIGAEGFEIVEEEAGRHRIDREVGDGSMPHACIAG